MKKAIEESGYNMNLLGDFCNSYEFKNLVIGHMQEVKLNPLEEAVAYMTTHKTEIASNIPDHTGGGVNTVTTT